MSDNFTVRFVQRSDFDKWLPLWDGYNAFYERKGPTALPRAITDMTWQRFFDGYEPVHGLVAESDGELLGLVHYLFHRCTTLIEPVCYLQDLFTDGSRARQGRRPRADRSRLRAGAAERLAARLLADARDQPHRAHALRQGRRASGVHRLSEAGLTVS